MTERVLRSHARNEKTKEPDNPPPRSQHPKYQLKQSLSHQPIQPLSGALTSKSTKLSKQDTATLNLKRSKLRSPSSQTSAFISNLPNDGSASSTALAAAARSTLVFAQHEAGTAVCIAASGLLLTCSHCVAESPEEAAEGNLHWLIFSSGRVVQVKCVAWDARRDLALLQIVSAEEAVEGEGNGSPTPSPSSSDDPTPTPTPAFPFATIALQAPAAPKPKPKQKTPLLCIGHPGSEDLETTSLSPVPSNYDVLHVSYGYYRGMAAGQDVHDNSEIGALKHDCWTYWGHSGAPLIAAESGEVVGLHSSWDERTAMRRGVGLEAIEGFLGEWCVEV